MVQANSQALRSSATFRANLTFGDASKLPKMDSVCVPQALGGRFISARNQGEPLKSFEEATAANQRRIFAAISERLQQTFADKEARNGLLHLAASFGEHLRSRKFIRMNFGAAVAIG